MMRDEDLSDKDGSDSDNRKSDPRIRYKFVKPVYEINRVCPLYFLAETSNEIATVLKENGIETIIGGSSAMGVDINVTSDYMRRRTSCDLDLFVRKRAYKKLDRLLKELEWKKYDESECGLIREYRINDGKQVLIDEYQNIKNFLVYHKHIPEYKMNFLIYVSTIGRYNMKLVKRGKLIEKTGFNRSGAESFVHKIFRNTRRDRSDFLAIAETDGLQQLLDDKFAKKTFIDYLKNDEENIEKLKYFMRRSNGIRIKYWNIYKKGQDIIKKKRQKKKASKELRVTIHYQTQNIETKSVYFKKLMLGMEDRIFWLDESLRSLEDLLENAFLN